MNVFNAVCAALVFACAAGCVTATDDARGDGTAEGASTETEEQGSSEEAIVSGTFRSLQNRATGLCLGPWWDFSQNKVVVLMHYCPSWTDIFIGNSVTRPETGRRIIFPWAGFNGATRLTANTGAVSAEAPNDNSAAQVFDITVGSGWSTIKNKVNGTHCLSAPGSFNSAPVMAPCNGSAAQQWKRL